MCVESPSHSGTSGEAENESIPEPMLARSSFLVRSRAAVETPPLGPLQPVLEDDICDDSAGGDRSQLCV